MSLVRQWPVIGQNVDQQTKGTCHTFKRANILNQSAFLVTVQATCTKDSKFNLHSIQNIQDHNRNMKHVLGIIYETNTSKHLLI